MAKQLDLTMNGVVYTDTYWEVGPYSIDPINQSGRIMYLGYQDAATFAARLEGPIDTRTVYLTVDTYEAYFSPAALAVADKEPGEAAMRLAVEQPEPFGLATLFADAVDV